MKPSNKRPRRRVKQTEFYPFESASEQHTDKNGYYHHYFFRPDGKEDIETTAYKTMSMMLSEAHRDLSPRQRELLTVAYSQFFGARSRPCLDFPEVEMFGECRGNKFIYLNKKLLVDVFGLYSENNNSSMYKDIEALVSHGFLDRLTPKKDGQKKDGQRPNITIDENGQMKFSRSIFSFSDKWKVWKPKK